MRQNAVSDNRTLEQTATVTPGAVKETAQLGSGENSTGNGSEGSEHNLNGQAHLMAVQQHRTEQPISGNVSATNDVHEPLTVESLDHVVQQVKEHLAARDYKAGAEQVCIRLTPEHMGELKLNLRMENQQLKVEIVAENSMVRDSLLKHSDALRETLAKQNITMESFDVSTSGNGSSPGRDQNDWRELAKQRQYNAAWIPADGYRKSDVPLNTGRTHQMRTSHSLVDVHF